MQTDERRLNRISLASGGLGTNWSFPRARLGLIAALLCLSVVSPIVLARSGSTTSVAANTSTSETTSDSTPQPLTGFNGTVSSRSVAPAADILGVDLGTNTFSYSSSRVSWADQPSNSSSGNFTVSLSSLSLSSTVIPLAKGVESLKNSTVVEESYSSSSPVLVGQTSCNPSIRMAFRNMTGLSSYDRDIVLSGTLGCDVPGATLSLQFVNALNLPVSDCDTNSTPNPCTSVFFGSMGFSWAGADSLQPVYDNASQVLSFSVGPSFSIDPLAIDGHGTCTGALTASTCTLNFTTSNSNDVIVLGQTASNTCNTPSSSPSLTWTQRKSLAYSGGGTYECMYYAVWSSSGSLYVTCSFGGTGRLACIGFGVSDANTTSIFDGNSAVPCSGTGTGSPASCSLSTSNSNDMIIGLMGQTAAPTDSAGSGFTGLCTSVGGARSQCAEYESVSSTQSSLGIKFTWSDSTTPWGMIGDAIKQAYVTQQIKCTTANSAPAATMTLSGASVNPTTLTCDGNVHDFTADPSQTITLTVPTDGSTSRYRLAAGATSTTVMACSSGTCGDSGSATFTIYFQYSQSVSYAVDSCDSGATCSAPKLSYTQYGSSTNSTLSTSASTYWIDYGTTASSPSSLTDSLGNLYYPFIYSWSITSANVVTNPITYWCGL
jgi:hypothetical protein